MKVALVLDDRQHTPGYKKFYDAVRAFYRSHNYEILETHIHQEPSVKKVQDFKPDVVFLWNGYHSSQIKVANPLRGGNWKVIFHEVGWLPQSSTMYMDNHGVCGDALKHEEWIPFNREKFIEARNVLVDRNMDLHSTSKQVGDMGRKRLASPEAPHPGYILVLGQLEQDTSMLWAGDTKTMQALVDLVARTFPGDRIIFRPHPVQGVQLVLPKNVEIVHSTGLYRTILNADAVIAINSTALLEALLLHVTPVALGRGVWPDDGSVVKRASESTLRHSLGEEVDWLRADHFLWHLMNVQVSITNPVFNERNQRVMLA